MVDDQIIEGTAVKYGVHIFEKLTSDGVVSRVEKNCLLIQQQIGVVGYSLCERKNILKQLDSAITCADPV